MSSVTAYTSNRPVRGSSPTPTPDPRPSAQPAFIRVLSRMTTDTRGCGGCPRISSSEQRRFTSADTRSAPIRPTRVYPCPVHNDHGYSRMWRMLAD
jgi:hypothetical protein